MNQILQWERHVQAQRVTERINVPFFRPAITDSEIQEVIDTLQSGWLTTGPKVKLFESGFAAAVGASYAVPVNSCTAALHLAVEALGLRPGELVIVPTMTFAATAEVVRYQGAVPVLVDCDPDTLNMSFEDAARKIGLLRAGKLPTIVPADAELKGIVPVHVGGMMLDIDELHSFAEKHNLWMVEDAAHAFPAAWRPGPRGPWQRCGEGTSDITCFSFYANKTITTGEGGIAVTGDRELADRMRMMSLHGLSHDAWDRYSGSGTWDYKIQAPGFKYNLTDIAAAIGVHQLARAEQMRQQRETIASEYAHALAEVEEIELPPQDINRIHSWHLYPIRLKLDRLSVTRDVFLDQLRQLGIGCSVHWRPLHMHPYYASLGWTPDHFPIASRVWQRLVSLPIFPGMSATEAAYVASSIKRLCAEYSERS
jgi:perosamine synthetase